MFGFLCFRLMKFGARRGFASICEYGVSISTEAVVGGTGGSPLPGCWEGGRFLDVKVGLLGVDILNCLLSFEVVLGSDSHFFGYVLLSVGELVGGWLRLTVRWWSAPTSRLHEIVLLLSNL